MQSLISFFKSNKAALYITLFIIVCRLIVTFTMGLMPQDAYYFYYSEHLDWSYFDHPPMVAWILWLFTGLLGKSVISVKLTSLITSGITIVLIYFFLKEYLPKYKAMSTTVLMGVTLMFSVI